MRESSREPDSSTRSVASLPGSVVSEPLIKSNDLTQAYLAGHEGSRVVLNPGSMAPPFPLAEQAKIKSLLKKPGCIGVHVDTQGRINFFRYFGGIPDFRCLYFGEKNRHKGLGLHMIVLLLLIICVL